MKYKSAIAGDIEAAREKANLDAACKRLLANKPILAWIMKSCLSEYADYTIKDIAEKYIEGTPEISSEPVHQDEFIPDKITGSDTGDTSINEGTVTYDIKFTAAIPNTKNKIHMYINIEAQNEYHPGYPLVKRGLYYCCRMISSQYNREFTEAHYEKLKKVCSIWICINPPQKRSNTITQYEIHETTVVGKSTEKRKNYDLMKCIMLNLGDPDDTEGILRLLDVLMSEKINVEHKKAVLEQDYKIEMTREIDREVEAMCNYSDGVEARAIERGMAAGMERGMAAGRAEGMALLSETLRKMGIDEATLQKAAEVASNKEM